MPEPIISAEGLCRYFDEVKAVDGIELSVQEGTIFGLVGPDGAGKTTSLRLLTTLLHPTAGSARVAGFDIVREYPRIRERIGYISERFNLYRDLTVLENLSFFADLHGITGKRRAETIERLLGFSRLGPFIERRAGLLSGGMKKKLALACALIPEPRMIFLDEPTTGVDPVSRRDFWNILSDLRSGGATLFITTPYMDEAERCNEIAFMQNGRVALSGRPEEIKQMITEEIVEVETERAREVVEIARGLPFVSSAELFGERTELVLADGEGALAALQESLSALGDENLRIRRKKPTMESVFVYMANKERAE